jgi:hypothetical protein
MEQNVPFEEVGVNNPESRTQIPEFRRKRKDSSGTEQNQGKVFSLMRELG